LDLSLSRCFLVFLGVFLEWEPEFVLDLSLCFLLLDRFVEVFDLFDFLDLVEFLDLDDFWLLLGDGGRTNCLLSSCMLPLKLIVPI